MLTDGLRDADDLQRQHRIAPHHDARPEVAHGVVLFVQPHGPAALRQCGADGEPCEAGSRDLGAPGRRLWCCHRSTSQTLLLSGALSWWSRLRDRRLRGRCEVAGTGQAGGAGVLRTQNARKAWRMSQVPDQLPGSAMTPPGVTSCRVPSSSTMKPSPARTKAKN